MSSEDNIIPDSSFHASEKPIIVCSECDVGISATADRYMCHTERGC